MQEIMLRYWTNFAYNGDPNGSGLALWPAYDANTDTYIELNDPCVSTQTGIRTAACNMWDQAASYTTCTSSLDVSSQASPQLAVFPNPTSGLVQWQGDTHGAWTLYSMSGQKISQGTGHQADVSALQAGMYLLQIEHNGQRLWAKVLRR